MTTRTLKQPKLAEFGAKMLSLVLPDAAERIFMAVGAAIGSAWSFAFGDAAPLLWWLTIFVIIDFFSGTWAALVTRTWSSHDNFLGVFKKIFVFVMVALGHGLDIVFLPLLHVELMQSIIICAYCAGEFGSIIENLERGGLKGVVPPVVRRLLDAVNQLVEKSVDHVSHVSSGGADKHE